MSPSLPTLRRFSQGQHVMPFNPRSVFGPNPRFRSVIIDEQFGENTDDKVKKYKSTRKAVTDGIMGSLTWRPLKDFVDQALGLIQPAENTESNACRTVTWNSNPKAHNFWSPISIV